jgi:hypothetical protein
MNAEILKPFFEQVLARFNGDYPVKVGIKLEQEFYPTLEPAKRIEEVRWSCGVWVDNNWYHGATLEEAFETAKKEFKPKDPARIAAAAALRKQAEAIENGESEISSAPERKLHAPTEIGLSECSDTARD